MVMTSPHTEQAVRIVWAAIDWATLAGSPGAFHSLQMPFSGESSNVLGTLAFQWALAMDHVMEGL